MPMYRQLIEDYLTHYQPELKKRLIRQRELQSYLESQEAAMMDTRERMLAQIAAKYPQISQVQREAEANQAVRELYLTLP